jgi:hypothetical protein
MEFPYNQLQIPDKCLIEKRVFKKLFYENAKLTVTDKKWFTKDIDTITWKYSLKPAQTLIHAIKEEEYSYDELAVIEVDLKKGNHLNRLADIIHRAIPYPLLIVFKKDKNVSLSIADKRFNQADDQAATIKELWVTDWLDQDSDIDNKFTEQLNYEDQPRLHLKMFYYSWIDCFNAYKVAQISGNFKVPSKQEDKEQRIRYLNEFRSLEYQIEQRRSELKKQDGFNDKVQLNVEIKELEKQLKKVADRL